jgi:hypothetical protein
MVGWIDGRLRDAGIRRRGPVDHVRSWARSALYSLETDHGRVWAKAVPEVFAHEVALSVLLTDIDPGSVAPALAVDVAAGRMLTSHVDGPLLSEVRDQPGAWTATLSRFAEIQRVLADDPAELAVAGVAAAPLGGLADAVPRLLDDDRLLRLGSVDGLSATEAGRVRGRAGAIADACHELAEIGIPDSLDHGDLAARQVILGDMGPVILDWSDGSLTHPFLSAAAFLDHPSATARGVPDRIELVDAYIGPWLASGVASADGARRAIVLASTVLPVHVAALYADRVLPGLGWPDDPDVTGVVPALLRRLA